ncbi:MAG: flippase [Candidatus Magasanikbacteria bacterium]|nr:flippase [Candidatus Magasanikbacteria bacterium]
MPGKITKNTLFLTAAYVGQKLFSFVYFSLIARFIGVEKVGLYVTALSFSSLFSVFADLGLTQVLIREGARDKEKLSKILSHTIIIKLFLTLAAYVILNLLVYLMGYQEELRQLVWISGILMILDALTLSFYGVLRSLENLRYEAIGVIVGQIIIVLFGLLVILFKLPVVFLLISLGAGSLFNLIFSFIVAYKKGIKIVFVWQKDLAWLLTKLTLPFALAGVFTKVYSYIDSVLLSYLAGTKNVGFYSIPNKVVFAFQFIPMAFAASLYPAMSKYFMTDKEKLKWAFEKAFLYLMMISAPLAVGVFIISDIFINSIYGSAYTPSIPALRILVFGLIFAFLDFPVGSLLNACNKQNIQTGAMGLVMVLNIILNLILIPVWGINGAAFSAVIGNLSLLLIGIFWVPKIIGRFDFSFWWKNFKILVSAFLMGLLLFKTKTILLSFFLPIGFIKIFVFLAVLIFIGVMFYFALLWISGILNKKEIKHLLSIVRPGSYESK